MRVINDRDEKAESTQVDIFAVMAHGLFCAVGFAAQILGPLPVIGSYAKLSEPWPKVAALLGAVLALTLFQRPPMVVFILFGFSLFVADSLWRGVPVLRLVLTSMIVAAALGVASLFLFAGLQRLGVPAFYTQIVDSLYEQAVLVSKALSVNQADDGEMLRNYFRFQGPFAYLSMAVLSLWMSVGVATHFGWIPKGHAYSSEKLREFRMPTWFSVMFGALFVAELLLGNRVPYLLDGVFIITTAILFIPGTITISDILHRRKVPSGQRTMLYCFAVVLGFYFVLLMGAVAPWIRRRPINQLEGVQ
jgi:hypothetical protein